MKVLWVNPVFLDYRVPVYKKLNELCEGNFWVIYSKQRMEPRVIQKIEAALGKNAIGLSNEKVWSRSDNSDFSNTELKLPYQPGLYKAINKIKADVVLAEGFFQWTPMALISTKLRRKKFMIAYERTIHTERNCPKWRELYRRIIGKFANGYTVNGQLTFEYLKRIGASTEKLFVGGMAADSEELASNAADMTIQNKFDLKQQLCVNKGLIYLYIGQFNERKGIRNLLKAWSNHILKFPEDTLLTLGTGPLFDDLCSKFNFHNSIKFLGKVNYDSIYKYYAIANVFVIPTLEDNWSLVVPEAMACGLPIACSIYNGCYPELIHEDKNGKLFDPLNQASILETLEYFHTQDLEQMSIESISIEKSYSAEAVANRIFESIKVIYSI